jgi:hypothetical protein
MPFELVWGMKGSNDHLPTAEKGRKTKILELFQPMTC